jgi:hypothetical protein
MSQPGDTGGLQNLSGSFRGTATPRHVRDKLEGNPAPFSLRLTFEERARLERESGGEPLGAYIRSKLFADQPSPETRRAKRPVRDRQALANVLGELGKSRIANNLNQLAKALNTGTLAVTPETETAIREACAGVIWLRRTLLEALGLKA